jgi:hypothetical protein
VVTPLVETRHIVDWLRPRRCEAFFFSQPDILDRVRRSNRTRIIGAIPLLDSSRGYQTRQRRSDIRVSEAAA